MIDAGVRSRLAAALGVPPGAVTIAPAPGGSVGVTAQVIAGRRCFAKLGGLEAAATFAGEAAGLAALRAAAGGALRVPEVIFVAPAGDDGPGFLLLEWIEPGAARPDFWERFGRGLAALHRSCAPQFGFASDNHIGRAPQRNGWRPRWPAFFRECRLAPQIDRARAAGRCDRALSRRLDALCGRLDDELGHEPPASLLHGDLWAGNFLCDEAGAPTIFDPACYHGDREADLAMTRLFGGFERRFYDAYAEAWPLPPGAARRAAIYNLYHALNHLNLFGRGYAGMVAGLVDALA